MSARAASAPARVLGLLSRLIPGGPLGESVLGDLEEEYGSFVASRGPVRAQVWLWTVALTIGLRWSGVRWARSMARVLGPRQRQSHPRRQGDSLVSDIFNDLRLSLRSLRRQPAFTAIVVVTLAVGIGANATVFSVLDALVLRPFPIPNLDRLLAVSGAVPAQGIDRDQVTPGDFRSFGESTTVFQELIADTSWVIHLTGLERPERLAGRRVSPGFLDALGVKPLLGRTLAAERSDPTRPSVVVSYKLWSGRLAGDPGILGRTLLLNGEAYEVVGVAPEGFGYPQGSDLWAPLDLDPEDWDDRHFQILDVTGLLAPGATIEDARAELALVAHRLERDYPETNRGRGVAVRTLAENVVDLGAPVFIGMWQIATLFVLLIVCVNVANLLIARGVERQQELSLRAALGANRRRIVRLLLTESLLLAMSGAALGVPLSWLGARLIHGALPPRIARFVQGWNEIDLDGRALLFTLGIAIATACVFGLAPALRASRRELAGALHTAARGTGDGGSRGRGRGLLVAGELALALMLVVASGLAIRGTQRLMHGDQGYQATGVLTAELTLPEEQYAEDEKRRATVDEILRRARAVPGVVAAEATNVLPSSGNNNHRSIAVEGAGEVPADELPFAQYRVATAGFLEMMRIPVLDGRGFDSGDHLEALPVAIVSKSMAQRLWPDGSPLGRRFRTVEDPGSPWVTVVGVCGDVLHDWFLGRERPTFYLPFAQRTRRYVTLALKTNEDPSSLTRQLFAAVAVVDPDLPLYNVATMQQVIRDRTIGLRFMASLMAIFGSIAVALAALGVYGLMSHAVARSRHELGVRLALGAQKRDVLRLTLERSVRIVALGLTIGLGLAFGAAKLMASTMFGVIQIEPVAFLQLPLVLVAFAIVATWIPAWRATQVDPARTLRSE